MSGLTMVYNGKQHNWTHGNGSRNRVFVKYQCYGSSSEVENCFKTLKASNNFLIRK